MNTFTQLLLLLGVLHCFAQSPGKIDKLDNFPSKFVKPRNVEVWLPPGYAENKKLKYPVLYMQDGQNVFNPATATNKTAWEADDTTAKLIAKKVMAPVIIVAIWNSDLRYAEYFPDKAAANFKKADTQSMQRVRKQMHIGDGEFLGDEYLSFIVKELKPFIDKKYRTFTDAANTSVCGSSMGALISLYAICEYPEVFGQAACMSTHWPLLMDNTNPGPAQAVKKYVYDNLPDPATHRIYFDHGTEAMDELYGIHQKDIDKIMSLKGYEDHKNWVTRKYDKAAHNEKAWQARFDDVLGFLYNNSLKAKMVKTTAKTPKPKPAATKRRS